MQIDITEEEREFLERVCNRAKLFTMKNLFRTHATEFRFENDMCSIDNLIIKLRSLDSNLINKALKDDH